jgi:hypothetical protein
MLARTEFDRLAAVRPAVPRRTEDVVDAAEEDRILRQILLSSDDAPGGVLPRPRARQRTRRTAGAVAGAVALALVAVGAVALVRVTSGPSGSPVREASHPAQTTPLAGPVIRLAGYSFPLPAGFTIADHPCAPGPAQQASRFAAAASAKGGCLEAFLAAGHAGEAPPNAQAVRVGPYRAFAVHGPRSSVRLYVKMPAFDGGHALVLMARRLSLSLVVTIAAAGLPSKIGPRSPCTNGCG